MPSISSPAPSTNPVMNLRPHRRCNEVVGEHICNPFWKGHCDTSIFSNTVITNC